MPRKKFVTIIPPFEFDALPVRETAKIVLETADGDYLFVAGKRGKLNLPGGGIDTGETAEKALLRELYEETGIDTDKISDLRQVIDLRGPITPANAPQRIAHWTVFAGKTSMSAAELSIPSDSETTEITSLSASECLRDQRVLAMAKTAIQHVAPKDSRPPRAPSIGQPTQSR